jgi:hypothetical protein
MPRHTHRLHHLHFQLLTNHLQNDALSRRRVCARSEFAPPLSASEMRGEETLRNLLCSGSCSRGYTLKARFVCQLEVRHGRVRKLLTSLETPSSPLRRPPHLKNKTLPPTWRTSNFHGSTGLPALRRRTSRTSPNTRRALRIVRILTGEARSTTRRRLTRAILHK